MKERPILFNGEMVRAILDGRKTQTRRPMKPQPVDVGGGPIDHYGPDALDAIARQCPHGKVKDQLWVRETWAKSKGLLDTTIFYRATDKDIKQRALDYSERENRWRPSIYMPRWASRIQLEITNVRVERLQDISEEDAAEEGLQIFNEDGNLYYSGWGVEPRNWFDEPWKWHCDNPRQAFYELWDGINFKRGFGVATNPWLWVIEFERVAA
jgi:hypothetical protein